MDFNSMELDDLKEYAKSIGITVGNIRKEKLIEKIKDKESDSCVSSVLNDTDIDEPVKKETINFNPNINSENSSMIDSISSAIDELEDSNGGNIDEIVEISDNTPVAVKSITYGGLTYKSRVTNALFRWNKIGAVQTMTIAQLNEMNNYSSEFLRKPMVILLDERAVKKFRLTSVYENVAKINNLTALFRSDMKTIERVITDAINVNMRDILISKVRQMYKNKKLVDVNILRLLQDKLQFDIMND